MRQPMLSKACLGMQKRSSRVRFTFTLVSLALRRAFGPNRPPNLQARTRPEVLVSNQGPLVDKLLLQSRRARNLHHLSMIFHLLER